MAAFLQASAMVLLAVILILTIGKKGSDMALLLSIAVCAMVGALAVRYLQPVMDFVQRLQSLGALNSDMLTILFKVVGIAFTAEIACLICNDAGNSALGKSLQLLASAVILYLSLPMLTALLELVEDILGSL